MIARHRGSCYRLVNGVALMGSRRSHNGHALMGPHRPTFFARLMAARER